MAVSQLSQYASRVQTKEHTRQCHNMGRGAKIFTAKDVHQQKSKANRGCENDDRQVHRIDGQTRREVAVFFAQNGFKNIFDG